LSQPNSQTVAVSFSTADGTAKAPDDYQGTSGTITFAPGQTMQQVSIWIATDQVPEANEAFTVNLFNPVNASIARATGVATIVDDDTPSITINDVTLTEGNSGSTYAVFTVSLSAPSPQTITVSGVTANGTAVSGSDYGAHGPGTVTFSPGMTSVTIYVPVYGDTLYEADETCRFNLSNPTNAILARPYGTATIANDDTPPS